MVDLALKTTDADFLPTVILPHHEFAQNVLFAYRYGKAKSPGDVADLAATFKRISDFRDDMRWTRDAVQRQSPELRNYLRQAAYKCTNAIRKEMYRNQDYRPELVDSAALTAKATSLMNQAASTLQPGLNALYQNAGPPFHINAAPESGAPNRDRRAIITWPNLELAWRFASRGTAIAGKAPPGAIAFYPDGPTKMDYSRNLAHIYSRVALHRVVIDGVNKELHLAMDHYKIDNEWLPIPYPTSPGLEADKLARQNSVITAAFG
jgi:hypothetical protein